MKEFRLEARKTARYFVLKPSFSNGQLLIALHGYGYSVQHFLKKLQWIADIGYTVVAPEALSRFYSISDSDRVGASWMTKEAREDDIADNIQYLEKLGTQIKSDYNYERWHLLGFSQGAATACRWAAWSQFHFESLILYASFFPPDFDFPSGVEKLQATRCVVALGDEDEYMDEENLHEKLHWLREKGINPEVISFEGGHEIRDDVLAMIFQR